MVDRFVHFSITCIRGFFSASGSHTWTESWT